MFVGLYTNEHTAGPGACKFRVVQSLGAVSTGPSLPGWSWSNCCARAASSKYLRNVARGKPIRSNRPAITSGSRSWIVGEVWSDASLFGTFFLHARMLILWFPCLSIGYLKLDQRICGTTPVFRYCSYLPQWRATSAPVVWLSSAASACRVAKVMRGYLEHIG